MKEIQSNFDYIICGGGMAGLSLAYYLSVSEKLQGKRILIIEPTKKNKNDRTWAFWEKGTTKLEEIVFRKWENVTFVSPENNARQIELDGYAYKLIRGIDFYEFTQKNLLKNQNITLLQDFVVAIADTEKKAIVTTKNNGIFTADWAFDSTFKLNLSNSKNHNLLQHFKGFIIKTEEKTFHPDQPQFMNFGVEQINNECRFMYVLPFSETSALIEYTLFSQELLTENEYDSEINKFIENELNITNFRIEEEEFGVIPMSDVTTNEYPSKRIVRIGTAGGSTNPATGYTFNNTQKRLQALVQQIENSGTPLIKTSWWQRRHLLYASILLNVLEKKRYPAAQFFDELYKKNKPSQVFKFLDNETTFFEEIKIMWSTPIFIFIEATIDVLKRKMQ
jgi:lycopene beta-cyclase